MKLRIEDNTLRLRLSEAEVQTFAATGQVTTTILFGLEPAQKLAYALRRSEATTVVEVNYNPSRILLLVPAPVADLWTATEQNGFAADLPLPNGQQLHVLVEKDLPCRH